jgi:murein DD-endopeptidase MepM/ murein hydrolase activator NlpD
MDSENNRRRLASRAAIALFLAAVLAACSNQTAPAPVVMKNGGPSPAFTPTFYNPNPQIAAPPRSQMPPPSYVTVRPGQSLNGIAHEYHVRPAAIITANGLKPPYELKIGARLVIPTVSQPPVQQAAVSPPPPPPQTPVAGPTPQPPPRAETLTPPAPVVASPTAPAATPPPGAPKTATDVIPLDTPPKQIAAAPNLPSSLPAPSGAAAPSAAGGVVPPVLPPRNPAAALPLPGEASVDWGSADAAQGMVNGRFPWPVRGRILANYGSTSAEGNRNDGINIAAPLGTPVRAIDTGVVAYAGNELKGFGNLVLIKHANGWISAYAHLDSLAVKVGEKIAAGQVFAHVGTSGGVGEPQLHFELRRGKKPVDPREFLAPAPSASGTGGNKAG